MKIKHNELTEKITGIFYRVYNKLGYGFLEKVYENALMIEFRSERIQAMAQSPIRVEYNGQTIGEYFADLMIADLVNPWTVARHGRPCFQVVSSYLIQNWTVKMPTY